MTLRIRPILVDDKPEWRRLWTAYLEFYETGVSEDVYDMTFTRLLNPDCWRQNGLIAVKDGLTVGLVHYIFHPHNWRIEDVCYLQDLYTEAGHRRAGVGRALIEAVYEKADEKGTPMVYWLTQDFNRTARSLYDRIATVTPFIKYQR